MRILIIHEKYLLHGGEDESCQAEAHLLREMGHQVDLYTESNNRVAAIGKLRTGLKAVWSRETYQKIQQQLREFKYDIVHVQNFFPLVSPSVYYAAKAEGVPIVQSLRNYRLFCVNAMFFRDGHICEDCLNKCIPLPGVWHSCYRGSQTASSITAVMLTVHRAMGTWNKMVDVYVTATQFAQNKFVEGGFAAEKIVVKPNCIYPQPSIGKGSGGYALFVGRLSVEKGLDILLKAWKHLNRQIPLKIVGDGPLENWVAEVAQQMPQVEWLKRKSQQEVYALMGEAMFLVFPSRWYETFGRVVIEAFAKGTPVIAADHGTMTELVNHHVTGLLFRPNDSEDLAAKVEWALANPEKLVAMRQAARVEFEAKYTTEQNHQQLMNIYALASMRASG